MMNSKDPLSVFNTEVTDDQERKGVSYWLWGNDTMKAQILKRYSINRSVRHGI